MELCNNAWLLLESKGTVCANLSVFLSAAVTNLRSAMKLGHFETNKAYTAALSETRRSMMRRRDAPKQIWRYFDMKRKQFTLIIVGTLVVVSAVVFVVQLAIFSNIEEAMFLLFQDLLFLPIHILFITFVVDRILHNREKRNRRGQLNIVVCTFFGEMGTDSIKALNKYITDLDSIAASLNVNARWTDKEFANAARRFDSFTPDVQLKSGDIVEMKNELPHKKTYLLELLNNPNLLENTWLTDLLWSLYHLLDEMESRETSQKLSDEDLGHLSQDVSRAYGLLLHQWVLYMKHLKNNLPYLFSSAVRKNPFVNKSAVIKKAQE